MCLAWKILITEGREVNKKGACLKISFTSALKTQALAPLRESWIKGSSDSRTIYMGRTVGLWRYKIEDFFPCPDGTLICVDGKLGDSDM